MDDEDSARARSNANLRPFQPGNPGRARGSRNKLGEQFLQSLYEDFAEHGVAAIQKVREERPDQYLKVIAAIIPKELYVKDGGVFSDLSDDELSALLASIRSILAGDDVQATDDGNIMVPFNSDGKTH